jgi:hypothetical protein
MLLRPIHFARKEAMGFARFCSKPTRNIGSYPKNKAMAFWVNLLLIALRNLFNEHINKSCI